MKKIFSFALLLLSVASVNKSRAQGAGAALNFNSNSLQTAAPVTHNIGTGDFTWEAWVKPSIAPNNTSGTGTGMMSNGSYAPALYASTGGTAPASGFGSLGIYWSGVGGAAWKNSGVKLAMGKWYHVAVVRSGTTLTFYVNGVQAPNTYTINATASMANAPFRLGYSGDGSENLHGNMDEVRIWSVARTVAELRDHMCRKLSGSEAGLKLYYRMDEASGTTIANAVSGAPAITFPATAPSWVSSGAPLGDTSVQLYAASYSGQSLSLSSPANGMLNVNNIADGSNGLHLYRVDAAPNNVSGIPNPGTNNAYYGIFTADTAMTAAGSSYDIQYDYTQFPAAMTYASGIELFRRTAADAAWELTLAANNQAAHLFQLNNTGRSEVIIGNFVPGLTCNVPSLLNAQGITTTTADLSWTSGGSNTWNLSWGTGNSFPPATGTIVHNLGNAGYTLAGLTGNTTYSFYVQDSCSSINSSSAWAGPYTFTTLPDLTMGAGTGLYFNGNESIQTAANVNHGIDTGDFTWEAWINPAKITGSTCILTNGNYVPALYATTAGAGGNGSVGFYWGGWKNSNTFIEKDKWSHVAMVRANDTITIYVNGIAAPNKYFMPNAMANSKFRIGWSGDISEYFQGVVDEVRVWKVARSQEELRAYMCRKLQGNEADLVNYFRLDEGAGTAASDMAGTAGFTAVNPARWRISGAAIGDTSLYVYPQDWTGVQLALSSNAHGSVTLDSVASNVTGMHLYRVNSQPNYATGIQDIGATDAYFGVFAAGDYNSAQYGMTYSYGSYPAAVAAGAALHVYNRKDNAVTQWVQTPSVNNTGSNTIRAQQALGTRQYVLADFSAAACIPPAAVTLTGADTAQATISWTSAAGDHVLEYGDANFSLGSGTTINANTNSISLSGLEPDHVYEYYLKDSCSATSTSSWTGPYAFSTSDPCPEPENVHSDSITTGRIVVKWEDNGLVTQGYTISWGLQGFDDPDIGIPVDVTEKRLNLTGLQANTTYDFYIHSNCNSSKPNSIWVGPFTFSTIACDVPYNLTAQNITPAGATLSWISGGAARYNLQYGPVGFNLGNGTLQNNITTNTYTLSGLQPGTAYEAYVQDSCSGVLGSSAWAGPVAFTTGQATGILTPDDAGGLSVFPNPAQDIIRISMKKGGLSQVTLSGSTGQVLSVLHADNKPAASISSADLASGVYFIGIITTEGNRITRKIVVQH